MHAPYSRPWHTWLTALAVATFVWTASAQSGDTPSEQVGSGPLATGEAVTQDLDPSHLLQHLDLLGWAFAFEAETAFDQVSVAVVAMTRTHLDQDFTRTPLGGALTVRRPEPSARADIGVLLDGTGDPRTLTLSIDGDTTQTEAVLPAPLSGTVGVVRRPFGPGFVLPADPDGRLLLLEVYPEAQDGVVATGDTSDVLGYLAVEIVVD